MLDRADWFRPVERTGSAAVETFANEGRMYPFRREAPERSGAFFERNKSPGVVLNLVFVAWSCFDASVKLDAVDRAER